MTGRARSELKVRVSASSMMRKLSVATIASNFTRRSGSMPSLSSFQRSASVDEKKEVENATGPYGVGWENTAPDTSSTTGSDDTTRLSVIQDENSPLDEKSAFVMTPTDVGSPFGPLKRLATLRMKKSWQAEESRTITPPLRASSANAINFNRTPPIPDTPCEGNENQHQLKHSMWVKAKAINPIVYTEGLRGFFR
jgi:hypothetical protein